MIEVIIKWHHKTKRYTPGHHSDSADGVYYVE